jgi:hypothetical protein
LIIKYLLFNKLFEIKTMRYLKTTLFIFLNLFFISLSYASSLSVSTTRGTPTSAVFEGGAFLSGVTEQSSFYKDNDVTVKVDITISNDDIGINSSIYIIVSYNGAFFIKNGTGNWEAWNGGINLIPVENRTLSTQESVTVISGLRDLPGDFLQVGFGGMVPLLAHPPYAVYFGKKLYL